LKLVLLLREDILVFHSRSEGKFQHPLKNLLCAELSSSPFKCFWPSFRYDEERVGALLEQLGESLEVEGFITQVMEDGKFSLIFKAKSTIFILGPPADNRDPVPNPVPNPVCISLDKANRADEERQIQERTHVEMGDPETGGPNDNEMVDGETIDDAINAYVNQSFLLLS
jgi:hypothetical protein